jgi:hypothetical protein
VDAEDAIACSCHHGNFDDIVVYSAGAAEINVADLRMRGEFVWLRMERGSIKQVIAIRTSSLHFGVKNLLEDPICAQYAA